MKMPIFHPSNTPPTKQKVNGAVRRAMSKAASPITPSRITTNNLPAHYVGSRERCDSAKKDMIASGNQASSGPQRSPSEQEKETSYSAVEEEETGTAQSFLESIDLSAPAREESRLPAEEWTDSRSCACCCRCGRGQKWKLGPRGRRSRSYAALRTGISELLGWEAEPTTAAVTETPAPTKPFGAGQTPLERLPMEILDEIIAQLALDVAPVGYGRRNVDLMSCLLTSRTVHEATLQTLYSHVTIPHSTIFSKFLKHLSESAALGTIVRRLDLSQFTSVGLGRTRQMNAEVQNLTAKTLVECFNLTPVIQEVLLQEHLDEDMDESVLQKIFLDLPRLRAVDLCGASSSSFKNAFATTIASLADRPFRFLTIRRLGLHECFTVPGSTFEALLPRLPRLTHLDVAHTHVTDKALMSIPASARLTHLNLGRCSQISGDGVVRFITAHPAVTGLVYLNLGCDVARYRLLEASHVEGLLSVCPPTLRSLNLNGAKIGAVHIPALGSLTKHLEELGISGADLSMRDINSFFSPPADVPSSSSSSPPREEVPWVPPALRYLDLTGIASVSRAALFGSNCVLLHASTAPLEVLELGGPLISALRESQATNKRRGWVVRDLGRRGWYVREPSASSNERSSWKMGARWWGMRKIPMAWNEVGGLYGHYMFKK